MDPRERRIGEYALEIDRVLDEWGYKHPVGLRDRKKSEIEFWLNNFWPSEIADAVLLLGNIQYKPDQMIRDAIAVLSRELTRIVGGGLERTRFYPLGLSASSSGGMYLYDFRKSLGLREDQFAVWSRDEVNTDAETLVFFDDMIGSGDQASRFFREHLSGVRQRVVYVSVFAFERGLDRVRGNSGFAQVISGITLSDEERAFGEDSQVFQSVAERRRVREIAEKWGSKLYPQHPLGYDDTQSLVVFQHNTPNNTLPIIWAGPNNEKSPGEIWAPLWQRRWMSGEAATQSSRSVSDQGTSSHGRRVSSSVPTFRDILLRDWQELANEELPSPHTRNSAPPPFSPKPSSEVDYVSGWNVRLRAGKRYKLTYQFGTNDSWAEIEIVLYQREQQMGASGGGWKRVMSAGAVTSSAWPEEVTPQSEDWLVTCWGKTIIGWDAPWWAFAPETYDEDKEKGVLALSFAGHHGIGSQSELSEVPTLSGSRSVLRLRALD